MNDPNKRNLQYFENASMKGLYADMEDWQNTNQKRLLSTSIQKDGDLFCCCSRSHLGGRQCKGGCRNGGHLQVGQ